MSSTFAIAPLAFFIVLHFLLLVATAAFNPGDATCGNLPSWACGSPFESVAVSNPQQQNIFVLAIGVVGGLFRLVFEFLAMDYDILKGDGTIIGGMGFVIRALGWTLILFSMGGIALQLFGRR